MIAVLADVQTLAPNIVPFPSAMVVGSLGRIVDAYIHGKMSMVYLEWVDLMNAGGPYPELIVDCANLMTAGRVEMTQFAVNDAGKAQPNQYGLGIYTDGKSTIDLIWNGDIPLLGLTRQSPILSARPHRFFREVGGLRTQGVANDYTDDRMLGPNADFLGEPQEPMA